MKRGPLLPTIVRVVCYVLVGGAYVLLLMSLSGCTLTTSALRSIGIPIGPGVEEAARAVDAAGVNWFLWLIGAGGVAATAKGAHVVHKRRKARKAVPHAPLVH